MRFAVALPTDRADAPDEFLTGAAVAEMARAAEGAGFDAVFVTDHPFPDDKWLAAGGHHALDPLVALAFAAAATTDLRVLTDIYVLAYRNPFLTAKGTLTLDLLSGGRLILGVATGYLRPEFAALGVDFDERNDLTDEAIDAIRAAWTQDGVKVDGRHFHARGNTMRPRPVQQPHPPIWVGGNSKRAIRRAIEKGDGWLPFPTVPGLDKAARTATIASIDDLAERLDYARGHAEVVGRARPLDVCFGLPAAAMGSGEVDRSIALDQVGALGALGVTWTTVSMPAATREAWLDGLHAFAVDVVVPSRRA